jgi:glucose-6-phosphate isomerase
MANPKIELKMDRGSIIADPSNPELKIKAQQISQQLAQIQSQFSAESKEDKISYYRAWSIVPDINSQHIQDVLSCAKDIRGKKAFVTIGIGGSDLCARLFHELINPAYYNMMKEREGAPEIYFTGDTFDPRGLYSLLRILKEKEILGETIFHIVSKSGKTGETFASAMIIREWLINAGVSDWRNQIIATTGGNESSVLFQMNKQKPFRKLLVMPDGVGGRFSAFTSVGLLLLAVTAINPETPEVRINKAINGITYANEIFEKPYNSQENIPYRLAEWLHIAESLGKSIMEFFDYADQRFLADWFVQLYDESVQERGQGLTVRPLKGPTCNHSALNGIINGPRDKVALFINWENLWDKIDGETEPSIPMDVDVKDKELSELGGLKLSQLQKASYSGTAEDFTDNGIPNVTLAIQERDIENVSALMRILMDTTAIKGRLQGLHLDENGLFDLEHELTYLQSGVEGYKQKTRKNAQKMQAELKNGS